VVWQRPHPQSKATSRNHARSRPSEFTSRKPSSRMDLQLRRRTPLRTSASRSPHRRGHNVTDYGANPTAGPNGAHTSPVTALRPAPPDGLWNDAQGSFSITAPSSQPGVRGERRGRQALIRRPARRRSIRFTVARYPGRPRGPACRRRLTSIRVDAARAPDGATGSAS